MTWPTRPNKLSKGWFGKWGSVLYAFANGYDITPVSRYEDHQEVKSIGNSTTTPRDLVDNEDVKIILYVLADSVARRLREHGCKGRTISISVRDNQLMSFTRQHTLSSYTNITAEIAQAGMDLFARHYYWQCPIRSLSISISDLVSDSHLYFHSYLSVKAHEGLENKMAGSMTLLPVCDWKTLYRDQV
ncbi:DinB/UmuC family translesion DNA polymerase [Faecalispora anaeroviscerum]|uniref:DinB/UmuC family translesion DNA polymerase n=1 Tax=Faecalispora anaeroviscerum TaxID=2991836 RepID=UPI0024B8FC47|nr:hypothetical protein [Faecalispora anaeroviscerum]